MNAKSRQTAPLQAVTRLTEPEKTALVRLLEATTAADRARRHAWQFAEELPELERQGVSSSALRYLVEQGLVAHAWEQTGRRAPRRTVRLVRHLHFTDRSCFILTEAGRELVRRLAEVNGSPRPHTQRRSVQSAPTNHHVRVRPSFMTSESGNRELRVLGRVVKEFRGYAMNQERILVEFQRQRWRRWIKNPFLGSSELSAKRRLHNTIDRLNRNQIHALLRFHGDGTGLGVSWELRRGADRATTRRR